MDLNRYLEPLEEEMRAVVAPLAESSPALLYGMLRYHLGWADEAFRPVQVYAGKRLRPCFLLLACEAQGGPWREAIPAAAAIELLHNFTLIHDDIEDRDEQRRGRPTLWTLWGVPQTINAGDALFALAYQAMLRLDAGPLPPDRILLALRRYSEAILYITEGQCFDLAFETQEEVAEAPYLQMIERKTAALLGVACELGGLLAGAAEARQVALREFGVALGMAFQMQDDVLGLWGDPARTGKPIGSDLRRRKKSLPILHGMAHSPALRELLTQPDREMDEAQVAQALDLLAETGSRAYTEERAAAYHRAAMAALERSQGQGAAHATLVALAEGLLRRDK
jgi:geranylgeranyl diphosphate synthase type I